MTLTTAAPSLAQARGSFLSHLDGAPLGFTSRAWTDTDTDARGTVVHLNNCWTAWRDEPDTKVGLRLWQDRRLRSDRNLGVKNAECEHKGVFRWNRAGAGRFYFEVDSVNGCRGCDRERLYSNRVFVGY